ncbi:hypothetical protein CROQUDRAFT_659859 [Cronartium quercuum f. sp. fusiforme G11]|uniref:tripeptidyl-peptidase II n=1 Tax=Cronartium quercuum f. sp. fusiforme G11 TaxID=708437 RepID=A0A9P6TBE2_9BASI|nr:hypothetical protein CROQUDRAFT_659859 [Cronartium quercuum f. sp. fusiforme G11]
MTLRLENLVILLTFALLSRSASVDYLSTRSQQAVLFETHRAPSTFTRLPSPPPKDHRLDLRIGLKTQLADRIEELLGKISDPSHSFYGNYLTDVESDQLAQPDEDAIVAVNDWLLAHSFEEESLKWSRTKDWVTVVDVPLPTAERMLNTSYSIFQHQDGEHIIRTESFSLPKNLHRHIDVVQPTTMFGRLSKQRSTVKVVDSLPQDQVVSLLDIGSPNNCSDPSSVTNDCLRKLYKTYDYQVKWSQKGNSIGITGYLSEAANLADAQMFLKTQRSDQMGQTFSVFPVNGGQNLQTVTDEQAFQGLGIEANLDTQTALGFTAPTPNIFYPVGGNPPFVPDSFTPINSNEPYLAWLEYILTLNNSQIPQVISTSYGDDEQTIPLSYAIKVCNAFGQLGARGVSVIFSSGDNGVGPSGHCTANDGTKASRFLPSFPASCPYVTAVGATQNFAPEVAVSESGPGGYTSGGGFTNYFERPSWQNADVNKYLSSIGNMSQGMYNQNGRAFPDVSAQGAKYVIAWNRKFIRVGGTSAAAPTFASVISLLNDYNLSNGGRSLGYLNPWLYATGRKGLNDITSGNSAGCDTKGFPAGKGWDPVTGLGTPDFKRLQTVLPTWLMGMRTPDVNKPQTAAPVTGLKTPDVGRPQTATPVKGPGAPGFKKNQTAVAS